MDESAQGILGRMRSSCAAGDIGARPDTVTYRATMSPWSKSGREDAADRAVLLLNNMKDLWKASDRYIGLYWAAYNADLNELPKSGMEKYVREAESLLLRMEFIFRSGDDGYGNMRLDTISYSSVMNNWTGCVSRAAPRRAKHIMRHMRDLQDAGNAAAGPDAVAYNTALKAWALYGEEWAVQHVEELLYVMEAQCEGGD